LSFCIHVTAGLKLPAWPEFEKRIQRQTDSLAQPFTFPVEPVELDLAEIDKLVRKKLSSSWWTVYCVVTLMVRKGFHYLYLNWWSCQPCFLQCKVVYFHTGIT